MDMADREMTGARVATCAGCGADVAGAPSLFRKHGYDLVRCPQCRLVFIANPPKPAEIAQFYAGEDDYHGALLDPGSRAFHQLTDTARQHLGIVLKGASSGRLLDIGCANGLFLAAARKAGFDVHGLEMSPATSAFARDHFDLDVRTGRLEEQDFAGASFDIVTSFDVIEHVPDPARQLAAMAKLLTPGGIAILSTPNIDGLFPRLSRWPAQWLDYWPHPEPPHHLYQFSARTLTAMVRDAGLTPERVDHRNIELSYSFGTPESWRISRKLIPYALLFAPFAKLGPLIRMGDWIYLTARKAG